MRKPDTQETIPGGRIVLPEGVREDMASCQVEVVAVGLAPLCEDPDCKWPTTEHTNYHRPVEVGDWLIIRPRSLVATDEDKLYVCKQDDALAIVQP